MGAGRRSSARSQRSLMESIRRKEFMSSFAARCTQRPRAITQNGWRTTVIQLEGTPASWILQKCCTLVAIRDGVRKELLKTAVGDPVGGPGQGQRIHNGITGDARP